MRAFLREGMVLGLLLILAMPAVASDDCDSCPADFNCDGRVDAADMGLLLVACDGDDTLEERPHLISRRIWNDCCLKGPFLLFSAYKDEFFGQA